MTTKRYEDLTPEHRAKIDAIRARRATPEARADQERTIVLAEAEIPPARPSPELLQVLATLTALRKKRGLSLADVSAASGIDRGMISRLENGKIANPTIETLNRYADAIGARLRLTPVVEQRKQLGRGQFAGRQRSKGFGTQLGHGGGKGYKTVPPPLSPAKTKVGS